MESRTPGNSGQRTRQPVGHGRALLAAFEDLEGFPALSESRDRVLQLVQQRSSPKHAVVAAVESDLALTIAVLRMANRAGRGPVESVPAAIDIIAPNEVEELASRLETVDMLERSNAWDSAPERFRMHGVTTQRIADLLVARAGYGQRDRLMVTCLLHDVGKLVLMRAYSGYPEKVIGDGRTPDDWVQRERRELGVDHAMVGGVIVRRWGLPPSIANAIERHHSATEPSEAALVRLADLIAHYSHGAVITPVELTTAARRAAVMPNDLRAVMYDLPVQNKERERRVDPCPLSDRELAVLRQLAEGKVYKQIARELALSTSTIRTHLHNVYGKLGAVDRAQAVLIARDRGWI
jgi:putative nucleotidyltransferase with HDIG domain